MTEFQMLLAAVGILLGGFFVLIVAVCLWEKQPIQPFYFPDPGQEYPPVEAVTRANQQAARLGFEHGCLCHFGKAKMYKVRYDFWITPDCSVISTVSGGTILNIPTKGIWFFTKSAEGRVLATTNEIGEQDISGVMEQSTWTDYEFEALYRKHLQRLKEIAVEPFEADKPLAGYFEIRKMRADQLIRQADAYYLNEEELVWRYTLKGALKFYVVSQWVRPLKRGLRSIGLLKD
ncbi:hypothetical protein Pan153_49650 [Gimesia panareensis]|uniref:DUF3137 domain-containing protein n=1 Tax=Gimesia panareensis TaxID=2527978 RepID=A0A518FVF7_9PLAN|nr:hypothetical protein [Gimesia panareensis]QDV20290.1 hypothetical protein Pan153_49650 [Gimesia panareensis]